MRHPLLIGAALATGLAVAGCASDQYGYGNYGYGYDQGYDYGYGYAAPYNAYYDGYYGPIYDGYWGTNGTFYYRTNRQERAYRADDRDHFRRDRGDGDHWREWRGSVTPRRGYTMPNYRYRDRGDHGGRGHHEGHARRGGDHHGDHHDHD